MRKDTYIFPAIFDYADDGISISFPDLPGCLSCADNDEEALYMAKDVLRGYLLVSEELGDDIPQPSRLKNIVLEESQVIALINVTLVGYREAYQNKSVKKTLTIPKWLNDVAEKENVNFSFVLQNALKDYLQLKNV